MFGVCGYLARVNHRNVKYQNFTSESFKICTQSSFLLLRKPVWNSPRQSKIQRKPHSGLSMYFGCA